MPDQPTDKFTLKSDTTAPQLRLPAPPAEPVAPKPERRRKDTARLVWDSKPKRPPSPRDIDFQTAEVVIPNPARHAFAIVPAVICLGVAGLIAAVVYSAGPQAVLGDVAGVARMPIPGAADVSLRRGSYGLYYGQLNAPTGTVMAVPSLSIAIVPPDGVGDPAFIKADPRADVYVERYHTVQLARIDVTTAGVYHVRVKSPEQNGGSFSIGALPAVISPGQNVLRAWPFIGLFFGLAVVLGVWPAVRAHGQR